MTTQYDNTILKHDTEALDWSTKLIHKTKTQHWNIRLKNHIETHSPNTILKHSTKPQNYIIRLKHDLTNTVLEHKTETQY